MKMLAMLLAAIGLSGCIAVPVVDSPGVYVAPPAPVVVVRPYGYYGYYGYYGGHRNRWP
jgi:hypothetical protein